MHARPCLHGEAGIDFLQLRHGLFGLLVVAGPGVGGGEFDERVPILRRARERLVAPFDRLFPLRQMRVEAANPVLPIWGRADREDLDETRFRARRSRPRFGRETSSRYPRSAWASALFGSSAIAASASAIACAHCRLAKNTHAFAICAAELSGSATTARSAQSSARAMSPFGSSLRRSVTRTANVSARPTIAGTSWGSIQARARKDRRRRLGLPWSCVIPAPPIHAWKDRPRPDCSAAHASRAEPRL